MSKVDKMATSEEREKLSVDIKNLKSRLNLTFAKLNAKLGSPCRTSTLQIRAAYPGKPISKKLLDKINQSISSLESTDTQVVLENLRIGAMKEVEKIIDNYVRNVEEHFLQQSISPSS